MSGLRTSFIRNLSFIAVALPSRNLLQWSGNKFILPFYHLACDTPVPHVRHLYSIRTTKTFREDLDFLLSLYRPLDFNEFLQLRASGKLPSKPSFLLSFDDGLREFYDIVAPILKEKGIPAICFLNSGFIDNADLFFRYKASLLIEHFLQFPHLLNTQEVKNWFEQKHKSGQHFREVLLSIPYHNRLFLDELSELSGLSFQNYLKNQKPYLDRDMIRALIRDGFYFGAHSIDHPEFQFISYEEQFRQVKVSVGEICRDFNLSYKAFSFPFTDYGVSAQLFEQLQRESIIDVSFGCAGLRDEKRRGHFQRCSFEENLSAKKIHNGEYLYSIVKKFVGKT